MVGLLTQIIPRIKKIDDRGGVIKYFSTSLQDRWGKSNRQNSRRKWVSTQDVDH
jgi:hypothetical protein